jgi:hypothetical protein
MATECLMVKTVDNRHFFTELGNFEQLIEYSKSQNAEISVVKPQESVRVLALPQLAKSLCDPNVKADEPKYELVERRLCSVTGKTPRQRTLAQAHEIRTHIESSLMEGETVVLGDLIVKFQSYGLGEAALRKHLTFVRLKLAKTGHQVGKVGVGSYRLQKQ